MASTRIDNNGELELELLVFIDLIPVISFAEVNVKLQTLSH